MELDAKKNFTPAPSPGKKTPWRGMIAALLRMAGGMLNGRRGNPRDCKKIARSGFLTLKKDPSFSS
jgi:hypothetical protein